MKTSIDRILTTHVGSLPRSKAVSDGVFAKEDNELKDESALHATIANAVKEVVKRQVENGIDVVSDGDDHRPCLIHRPRPVRTALRDARLH